MYFSLKEPKSKSPSLVIVRYFISSSQGRFVYSTGLKVNSIDWDFSAKTVKNKRGRTDLAVISNTLNKYSQFLSKLIDNYKINEIEITRQILKNDFDVEFKNKSTKSKSFFDYFDDMVAEKNKANQLTIESLKKYNSIKNKLIKYEKHLGKTLTFKDLDKGFYESYLSFAYNNLNQLDNTIGRQMGYFKTFLLWSFKKGYHDIKDYSHIKRIGQETDDIALSKDEVLDVYNFNFDNESEQRVIDVFLIGCFTGQRFSDYSVFNKTDYVNGRIEKRAKKTKTLCIIPVDANPKLKGLLEKYEWKLPKITNQKFNIILRKALSKIDSLQYTIKKMSYQGVKSHTKILKKWEMCSSHTARRTFISLSIEDGWSYKEVMRVSGIKDVNTIIRYDKISNERLDNRVKKSWA